MTAMPAFTSAMRVLAGLLEARTGQILSENRIWRIETALKPILRDNGLNSLEDLVAKLSTTGQRALLDTVVNALLNNESSFFRDLQVFNLIYRDLLPHLRETLPNKTLRIWCAGCSTGQEAYSLAIQIRKDWAAWAGWRIQILATDISNAAIAQARSGIYSQIDVQRGLGITDLIKWFEPAGEDWAIGEDLKRMVDFRVDNLFDAQIPSGQYDLILCRNVMLYFSQPMRKRAFEGLARHSQPGSMLLLGAGETVMGLTDDFTASQNYRGSYERVVPVVQQRIPDRYQPRAI